jgi:toxoflavin synthase
MSSKEVEYNGIAEKYFSCQEELIQRKYIFDPCFLKSLGNLTGKSVLDLACGSGQFTREIKKLGARDVVGVDSAEESIKLAVEEENKDTFGIDYKVLDATKPVKISDFDIISAGFLFHYAKTKEELEKMCTMASINLKPSGRLVSIGPNPVYPLTSHKKYGFTLEGKPPVKEGDRLITRLYNGKNVCDLPPYYHWNKETYEDLLSSQGFEDIKWVPLNISQEGIEKYDKPFWEDFLKEPSIIIIEAKKSINFKYKKKDNPFTSKDNLETNIKI